MLKAEQDSTELLQIENCGVFLTSFKVEDSTEWISLSRCNLDEHKTEHCYLPIMHHALQ